MACSFASVRSRRRVRSVVVCDYGERSDSCNWRRRRVYEVRILMISRLHPVFFRLWDVRSQTSIGQSKIFEAGVVFVDFPARSNQVVTGSYDEHIRIIDRRNLKQAVSERKVSVSNFFAYQSYGLYHYHTKTLVFLVITDSTRPIKIGKADKKLVPEWCKKAQFSSRLRLRTRQFQKEC